MSVVIENPEANSYVPQVAVFCAVIGALSLFGIDHLQGRFSNIKRYISGRTWPFLKNSPDCHNCYVWYYNFIIPIIIFMCPAAFALWCIILFYNEYLDNHDYIPALAITFIGVVVITFPLAYLSIKWNKYRFTYTSIILFFIYGLSFLAYQITENFEADQKRSFFGLSAVFLTCNDIIFLLIIFLNEGKNLTNFFTILDNRLEIQHQKVTTEEELMKIYQMLDRKTNPEYETTKMEIEYFFTIKSEDTSLVSGGTIMDYASLEKKTQTLITIGLYFISLLILIGYAILIYKTVDEYKLGFITMASTIVIDSIVYLFHSVKVAESMLQVSLTSIVFRLCLFVCGGKYWYYGYCILYGLLGLLVCHNMSAKYFPIRTTIPSAKQAFYSANFRMELKDLMKTPEFIFIYATFMFGVITICMIIVKPKGVPLPSLYSVDNEYPFWNMSLLTFGIVILFYLLFTIIRIIIRGKQKIVENVYIFFFKTFFSVFWIHVYLCYGLFIVAGLVAYGLTKDSTYIIVAAFIPFAVIFLIYLYIHYAANDYRMTKNIAAENERRTAMKIAREERAKVWYNRSTKKTFKNNFLNGDSKAVNEDLASEETQRNRNNGSRSKPFQQENNAALEMAMKELEELEILEDWRTKYNAFTAFWSGKLFSNDYKVIIGFVMVIVLLFLNSMTLELTKDSDSLYGITLSIILVDSYFVVCGCFKFLATDLPFKPINIVFVLIGIAVHIIYGVLYFVHREDCNLDVHGNLTWLWIYLFIVPPLLVLIMGFYKWYKQSWRFGGFTLVMCLAFMANEIAFGVHLWIRYSWLSGTVVFIVLLVMLYGVIFICNYVSNGFSMTVKLSTFSILFCLIVACGILIPLSIMENFATGFTVTYGIIAFAGAIFFFGKLINGCRKYDTNPIFISPYVFPVYAYSTTKKTIIRKVLNVGGVYIFLLLIIVWGAFASMFISPMHYGVSVTCLGEILFVFISFYLILFTPSRFKEFRKWLTKEVLSDSWLEAKKAYIESEKIKTLGKLVTYRYLLDVYDKVFRRLDITEIRITPFVTRTVDMETMSNANQDALLAELKANIEEQYYQELELMIEFELMALLIAANAEESHRRKILKFADENQQALDKLGIDVELKGVPNQKLKYTVIMNQITKLQPRQQGRFNEILAEYEKKLEEMKREEEDKEKKAEEERMKKLKTRIKPKIDYEAEKFLPIDEMSDSWEKYDKIWHKYKANLELGIQYKYEDKQFPPNDKSIGENLCKRFSNWREVNPKNGESNMVLYDDNGFDMDIKQGALGDCYFLSALTVMGEKYLKKCLWTRPDEIGCGTYCVRFFNDEMQEEVVLVDDYFPVDNEGKDWAFVKSENGKELWPMVLEKAYAKFFGSYENIEAGKVSYALADLTGGVPEQIKLEDASKNFDEFCKKILSYYNSGYLMGAGSNSSVSGDAVAINGIVQSHAYAVLQIAVYNDEKLIKLRNPHGSGGIEWSGDWSDESKLWTEAAKAKLNYNILNKKDGVFWMTLNDFIFNFDNLYICRIFDEGWFYEEQEGEWNVGNTPGLPNESNSSPKLQTNPHYTIYVTQPASLFIELTQFDTINMFQGRQSIYFFIANNGGKRITKTTRDIKVCSSYPPTNLITVTKEIILDSNFFYPVTLTVMVSTETRGVCGKYLLKVYCTDDYFSLNEMK